MTAPALFENYVATGATYKDLPDPEQPYFVIAEEGTFMHRKTALGKVLVPAKPKKIGSVEYEKGVFYWDAPIIPGSIIAQATDFFRRIYRKHKTEAEVIITYHPEEKRFRLFVPVQRVSYSGVKSIYDPSHIQKGWLVVGTLHSHCNFSAFHSGTDSADASDMDGVHFTIGMLERETPEIVAMVAMNGKEFHYEKPETIAEIVFEGTTAPEWWDDFVYPGKTPTNKPKGFRNTSDEDWNSFKGVTVGVKRTQPTSLTSYERRVSPNDWQSDYGNYHSWYGYNGGPSRPLRESEDFNRRTRSLIVWRKKQGSEDGDLHPYNLTTEKWVGEDMSEEEKILDFVIDSAMDANLLDTSEIATLATMNRRGMKKFFLSRMNDLAELLELLEIKITFKIEHLDDAKPVKGQTQLFSEDAPQ